MQPVVWSPPAWADFPLPPARFHSQQPSQLLPSPSKSAEITQKSSRFGNSSRHGAPRPNARLDSERRPRCDPKLPGSVGSVAPSRTAVWAASCNFAASHGASRETDTEERPREVKREKRRVRTLCTHRARCTFARAALRSHPTCAQSKLHFGAIKSAPMSRACIPRKERREREREGGKKKKRKRADAFTFFR